MNFPLLPSPDGLPEIAVANPSVAAGWGRSTAMQGPWLRIAAIGAVAGVWALAVVAGAELRPELWVQRAALFGHLLSLVTGLGAVLVLDTYGAGCLLRKRSPVVVAQLAASLDMLIWAGLVGLVITGALLSPNLSSPFTWVKLGAVLVAGLNGINAHGLRTAVASFPATLSLWELPRPLLLRLLGTAVVSQTAWWLAVLIGYWNNLR